MFVAGDRLPATPKHRAGQGLGVDGAACTTTTPRGSAARWMLKLLQCQYQYNVQRACLCPTAEQTMSKEGKSMRRYGAWVKVCQTRRRSVDVRVYRYACVVDDASHPQRWHILGPCRQPLAPGSRTTSAIWMPSGASNKGQGPFGVSLWTH